jgi:hypothetical protein
MKGSSMREARVPHFARTSWRPTAFAGKPAPLCRRLSRGSAELEPLILRIEAVGAMIDADECYFTTVPILSLMDQINRAILRTARRLTPEEQASIERSLIVLENFDLPLRGRPKRANPSRQGLSRI